jgi:hypothetical protein
MHIDKPAKKFALVIASALPAFAFAAPPADSAYTTDAQHSYVEDATSKGIGQVNMIACIINAMAPDKLVNQGNYLALIDESKCDPNSRSSTSNSGSTDGAQAATYMTATVNSARASNSDPMITKAWLDEADGEQKTTIFVHIAAQQAPSTSNPYGVFRLDFCGKAEGQSQTACMMNGFLDAGSNGISYFEQESRDNGTSVKALRLNASGSDTGSGKLSLQEGGSPVAFDFAYNHDYFLRGDQCFSRDASDAETQFSVWRYGVYDAVSGDRVTVNSGFPIEYAPSGATITYHGYLGYGGLQLPPDAMTALSAEANPVVQKVDYSNAGQVPMRTAYSVVRTPGKLTKYTKQTRTLKQIDKIKLNVFVGDASTLYSGAASFTQYEMYWDDTNATFKVDGQMNCGNSGCQIASLPAEQPVALSFFSNLGGLQGWSQSLGGEVFIDLHGVALISNSDLINVVYRSQDLVYPEDMAALGALYCLRDCPTAASMSAYFGQSQQSPVQSPMLLANNWNGVVSGNQVAYTTAAGVLKDALSNSVVFTDQSALSNFQQYQNGVRSGRLFTSVDLTAGSVDCDNQPGSLCDYKVNSLDVYYVWETGANSWNQFAGVKDGSNHFLHFEAPLQLNYTVPAGSQYGEYAGKSIVLQYGGFGDLWGIPGHCVSHLTNQTVDCGAQSDDIRYVPAFIIPSTSNQVSDGTHTYLVKWLEREIRFARKDMNANSAFCAGLSTSNINVTLPTAAGLKDPSSSAQSDVYLGVKPVVTDSPRVIQGEVKY